MHIDDTCYAGLEISAIPAARRHPHIRHGGGMGKGASRRVLIIVRLSKGPRYSGGDLCAYLSKLNSFLIVSQAVSQALV
eukprot:4346938-Prymnesium_polylepis.1